MSYEVVYRTLTPYNMDNSRSPHVAAWHHDSYHANRDSAETRASQLILSGLQVRIREVEQ
jgi:hypothetical protein